MQTNTFTTAHIVASEGYCLTQADNSIADTDRTYQREIYCGASDPQADPAYWREIPQSEAEAAMAAQLKLHTATE